MKFSRILRGLIRLVIRITLLWFLFLVIYFVLPAFEPSDESAIATLRSGKPLLRAYYSYGGDFFPYSDKHPSVVEFVRRRRQYFIVELQLQHDTAQNETFVSIGGGRDPLNFEHSIFADAGELTDSLVSLKLPGENGAAVVLDAPFKISVGMGDTDGISLPYFPKADAALFHWWTQHESIRVPLRTRYLMAERKVEIWPVSSGWSENYPENAPRKINPLLTVHIPEDTSQTPQFEFAKSGLSTSPSIFYPVRLCILFFLVPIGFIGLGLCYAWVGLFQGIFYFLAFLVSLFLNLVTLCILGCALYGVVWWFRNGRPSPAVMKVQLARWAGVPIPEEDTRLIDLESQTPLPQDVPTHPITPSLVDVSPSTPLPEAIAPIPAVVDTPPKN